MALPTDAKARKDVPITTGVLDYFPDALAEVARVSKAGNDQHNPGQPLHWAREKSTDHDNCIGRHLLERGGFDTDGQRHSAKLAWRALALLQTELENEMHAISPCSSEIEGGSIPRVTPIAEVLAAGLLQNPRHLCLASYMPGSGSNHTCSLPHGHDGKHQHCATAANDDLVVLKEW